MTNTLFFRRQFFSILKLTSFFLLSYAAIIYFIDPLQQYRLATFFKPVYTNEIYQNPGLAKQARYDTVIIGSSMTENFKPAYIKKQLGFETLKLSISGSNSYEEKMMLKTALQTNQVKQVIYGLDIFRLSGKNIRSSFPTYLYTQDNFADKLKYLFNIGNVDFILKVFVAKLGLAYKENREVENAFTFVFEKTIDGKAVLDSFKDQLIHSDKKDYSLASMQQHFDENILSTFIAHPQTTFYVFFPPYSIYTYKLYEHEKTLSTFLAMKKYIVQQTKSLSNVKLYDFQTESLITTNLSHYKDISHYSSQINEYIVDQLATNKYLLTEANIDAITEKLLTDVKTLKV